MGRRLPQPRQFGLALLALVGLVPMACGTASSSLVGAIPTASTAPTATPAFKVLSSDGSELGFITDVNNVTANYATLGSDRSDPTQLLQVTHFWGATTLGQPVSGVTHDHPVGVRYVNGQWAIFNEDHAAMPIGATFNIGIL